MLVKIVAVQARLGVPLTLAEKIFIFKQRPDFVCLPEYYLLDGDTSDYARAAVAAPRQREYLERLSYQLSTCLIGGTVVEAAGRHLYNTAYCFDAGQEVGRYRKRYPMPGELAGGITPGDRNFVFERDGVRVGVMICGDVFHPDLFVALGEQQVDVVFIPTTSPYRPDDTVRDKARRDRVYFVDGARAAGAFVVKVCGVGSLFGRPLQGRSLIAAPWGVLQRVEPTGEQRPHLMSITLDIAELREFRRRYAGIGRRVSPLTTAAGPT